MLDLNALIPIASAATIALAIVAAAALHAWRGWLDLKRAQMGGERAPPQRTSSDEMKRLKERVRKLEAIASGSE